MAIRLETIGNATLILYENDKPLISTDPWFDIFPAYFGSWKLSHKFPSKQKESVQKSKYIFISHGHPDHLNMPSLSSCRNSTILLAQHYGNRIEKELRKNGFNVIGLPSRKWINLSSNTRIILFNNELQDSALLIEITDNVGSKSLVLNLNDSGGLGFEKEAAFISSQYKNSIYLQLHCWGDADMINLFDSKGKKILPRASKKFPVGKDIKVGMKKYNANIAIPFSNLHQYQRRDSFWANEYVTPISLMSQGFVNNTKEKLLPAFQEIKFRDGELFYRNINPDKINIYEPVHESQFGDDWQDVLNNKQVKDCEDYFHSISNLFKNYQSIILNVGGNSHEMLSKGFGKAKIIFKVPKTSLLKAIRQEIFDDLLIGNFMKTQIIRAKSLYSPDFTFTVAKYSDNGRVQEPDELFKYFNYYNHRRSLRDKLHLYFFSFRKKILENLDIDTITKIKYILRK